MKGGKEECEESNFYYIDVSNISIFNSSYFLHKRNDFTFLSIFNRRYGLNTKDIERVLYLYPLRKKQIETDKLKLKELRLTGDIFSVSFDDVKVNTSNINNITENKVISYLEKRERIEKRIRLNEIFCERVEKGLELLDDTGRKIIEGKYFFRCRDYEVYMELGISKSNYYVMRKKVLSLICYIFL